MRHVLHQENPNGIYKVIILIKESHLNKEYLEEYYVKPLNALGIASEDIVSLSLAYNDEGKAPVSFQREALKTVLKAIKKTQATHVLCCDSNYFKTLTRKRTAEPHHGYITDCAITDYEDIKIVLGINYSALFHNPSLYTKIDMSLKAISDHIQGKFQELGTNIIHSAEYLKLSDDIVIAIKDLHQYPALTCDIETFGLSLMKGGIATISFAWDQHNGIAFQVEYNQPSHETHRIYKLLKQFFRTYTGTIIYHNASFDIKHLIFNLFMKSPLDQKGLLDGLEVMFKNMEDTKIITYLATNSTAGNNLSLKHNAFEFAGNYAQDDIDNIRLIPIADLLKYNLTDAITTWYVHNKNTPVMIKDNQEDLYKEIMLPSLKVIAQMELTGMPNDPDTVQEVKADLHVILHKHKAILERSAEIIKFTKELRMKALLKRNSELKTKVKVIDDFADIEFNPGSPKQTGELLHDWFDFPITDTTDTGAPSVGKDILKKHLVVAKTKEQELILKALIGIADVSIIISTFIKALETKSILKGDGVNYLHGNFNLGGTKSGRLSSNSPNLQNIPSTGTIYAKMVKQCFIAPQGWLMMGADYSSLEDRISALTTKDPQKLKVYTDLYDGHCLRAYAYYQDQMPDIQLAKTNEKVYKVTYNNGSIKYKKEHEL